jgi:hypothetical protein
MGRTSQEAYNNFISAFNNEQELTDPTAIRKVSTTLKKEK